MKKHKKSGSGRIFWRAFKLAFGVIRNILAWLTPVFGVVAFLFAAATWIAEHPNPRKFFHDLHAGAGAWIGIMIVLSFFSFYGFKGHSRSSKLKALLGTWWQHLTSREGRQPNLRDRFPKHSKSFRIRFQARLIPENPFFRHGLRRYPTWTTRRKGDERADQWRCHSVGSPVPRLQAPLA